MEDNLIRIAPETGEGELRVRLRRDWQKLGGELGL